MIEIDFSRVYLSDFGLGMRIPLHGSVKGRAGTPCYYSYEMVKQIPYDTRLDLWCLGVLLFEMLYGELPFKADEKTGDLSGAIERLEFKIPKDPKVGPEAGELIKRLLVPEADRATAAEIEAHPWIHKTEFANEEDEEESEDENAELADAEVEGALEESSSSQ